MKTPPKEEFNPNDPYELATPRFDNSYAPDQSVMTAEWKTSSDKKKDEQHYEEEKVAKEPEQHRRMTVDKTSSEGSN